MSSEEPVNNDELIHDDDLGSENESDNESIVSDNPAVEKYNECKIAAKLNKTDPSPNNIEQIESGILKLKSIIHEEFFQKGTAAKVHDTERLNDYVNVCGNIYRHITQGENLEDYGSTINEAIQKFLELWGSNQGVTHLDREMQTNFLHLHLICYCYCHNSDCLSMDDSDTSDNNS